MVELTNPSISPIQIFNQVWPDDCPKSISLDLDFAAASDYDLNLLLANWRNQFKNAQAIYYDNQQNAAAVNLTVSDSGQRMYFRAGWQGYRPVLLPAEPRMRFSCTGGTGIMRVILLNAPIQPIEWAAV